MKAKSLTRAEIDSKRKVNTADSCYFYVPANAEGQRFIKAIRKHLNRARFDLKVRRRGLHADRYGGVKPENVTHYGISLYSTFATKRQWEQYRQSQEYWYNKGLADGIERGQQLAANYWAGGVTKEAIQ